VQVPDTQHMTQRLHDERHLLANVMAWITLFPTVITLPGGWLNWRIVIWYCKHKQLVSITLLHQLIN